MLGFLADEVSLLANFTHVVSEISSRGGGGSGGEGVHDVDLVSESTGCHTTAVERVDFYSLLW